MPYRFGPFTADRASYRVWRDDEPVELTPKLLDLLFHFLEHPAVLVSKEELLDQIWPGANVTDNAVAQAISDLRDALGDRATDPRYIRTVARRGYRFVAPVARDDPPDPAGASPVSPTPAATGQSIAVLDFQNVTDDPELAWLSVGIAETVTNDLAALDQFRVVDRRRVSLASRQGGRSVEDVASALDAHLLVTGGFQRHGPRIRITGRLVDVARGETLADAKVDGAVSEVFELQDGIVAAFARALDLPGLPASGRIGVRETSSLDAYRAFTEGLVKTESLDTDLVRASITDFERAIQYDSAYAMAYTGLANAQFVAYEMTRTSLAPDTEALAAGIAHAERAIHLDDRLAEAHATLSFLLVSAGQFDQARTAAQRAVALEPDGWRNQYRLGHASWGTARLRALERALALYPQFPYAAFESAMVHVARGHVDQAERIVRHRVAEAHESGGTDRFPAVGFYWLQGMLDAAGGRHDEALAAFDRELGQVTPRRLYGPEYAAAALTGRGHSLLATARPHEARQAFRDAHGHVEGYAPATVGEALSLDRLGKADEAAAAWRRAEGDVARLEALGRRHEALLASAMGGAARGRVEEAVARLDECLSLVPPSHVGWRLPVEPVLTPHRGHAGIAAVLAAVAERAR